MNKTFGSNMKKSNLNIVKIPIEDLVEYSDSSFESVSGRPQPFKEYSEDKLAELVKSVSEYGIMQPISVRPYNGKYQIMAGRNRTRAAKLAGKTTVPAIIYPKIDDMGATIIMLDTNLKQRDKLQYSELGFAYRMKMELLNRRGKRTDLLLADSKIDSLSETGKANSQSRRTVANLIRLTYLLPELLQLVDDRKLSMMAGVHLSYLSLDSQKLILDNLFNSSIKINKADAIQLRAMEKEHKLTVEALNSFKTKNKPYTITITVNDLPEYSSLHSERKDIEKLFLEFLKKYKETQQSATFAQRTGG